MYTACSVDATSSKSLRNVNAVNVLLSAAANAAEEYQSAAPVACATSAVPIFLIRAIGAQADD